MPADMDHNEFQIIDDLIAPFKQFILGLGNDRCSVPDLEMTSSTSEITEMPEVPDVPVAATEELPARCKTGKGGNVRYPSDPVKYKYMINRHE